METPIIIYLDLFAISRYHIHIRSRRIYDTAGPDLNTLEIKRNIPNWSYGTKIYNNFIVISKKMLIRCLLLKKKIATYVTYLLTQSLYCQRTWLPRSSSRTRVPVTLQWMVMAESTLAFMAILGHRAIWQVYIRIKKAKIKSYLLSICIYIKWNNKIKSKMMEMSIKVCNIVTTRNFAASWLQSGWEGKVSYHNPGWTHRGIT